MDKRGQSAAFDMVLVLLAFSLSMAAIFGSVGGGSAKTHTALTRDEFTESLLLTMIQCTVDAEGYEGMTVSDLAGAYFRNQTLNSTLTAEIEEKMTPYANERKLDWVVYANHTQVLWVPAGNELSGSQISSANAQIPLADNTSAVLYLFIKWD